MKMVKKMYNEKNALRTTLFLQQVQNSKVLTLSFFHFFILFLSTVFSFFNSFFTSSILHLINLKFVFSKIIPSRKTIKLLLALVGAVTIFLLLSQTTLALGVAPSFYSINEKDASFKTLNLRVLNTQHEELTLLVSLEGDLADDITIQKVITLTPEETEKTIHYTLSVKTNLTPGPHEGKIVLQQIPDEKAGATNVAVATTVVQKINVAAPYPGVYLTGSLYASSADVEEQIKFTVKLKNKGSKPTMVKGQVIVKGPTNEELYRVQLPEKAIAGNGLVDLESLIPGLKYPGYYTAEAILTYDGKAITLRKDFSVGSAFADTTGLSIEQFRLGEIVKLSLSIQNKWNSNINELYAVVKIVDSKGAVVSKFTTSTIKLNAQELTLLDSFWDTRDLQIGTYDFIVGLHYNGKVNEQIFKAVVGLDNVRFGSQVSGNVIMDKPSSSEGFSNLTLFLLAFLVLGLIVMNIAWLFYFKKKKK